MRQHWTACHSSQRSPRTSACGQETPAVRFLPLSLITVAQCTIFNAASGLVRGKRRLAGDAELAEFNPAFLWLLRDFYLELEEDGRKVRKPPQAAAHAGMCAHMLASAIRQSVAGCAAYATRVPGDSTKAAFRLGGGSGCKECGEKAKPPFSTVWRLHSFELACVLRGWPYWLLFGQMSRVCIAKPPVCLFGGT